MLLVVKTASCTRAILAIEYLRYQFFTLRAMAFDKVLQFLFYMQQITQYVFYSQFNILTSDAMKLEKRLNVPNGFEESDLNNFRSHDHRCVGVP